MEIELFIFMAVWWSDHPNTNKRVPRFRKAPKLGWYFKKRLEEHPSLRNTLV